MDKIQAIFDNLPDGIDPRLVRAALMGLAYLEVSIRLTGELPATGVIRTQILASLHDCCVYVLCEPNDIVEWGRVELIRLSEESAD